MRGARAEPEIEVHRRIGVEHLDAIVHRVVVALLPPGRQRIGRKRCHVQLHANRFEDAGKKGRRAYGFDDIAIVPSRRTRDPDDIDIAWTLGPYRFDLPLGPAQVALASLGLAIVAVTRGLSLVLGRWQAA